MANAFLDGTAAGLMVLASALRLPDAVTALGRACPNAMDAELDPAQFMRVDVGAEFQSVREVPEDEEDKFKRSCRFKPALFAMQFGAGSCVDALVASGWNPRGPLGSWYNPGPDALEQIPADDPWRAFNRRTSKTGLTLVDILTMQANEQITLRTGHPDQRTGADQAARRIPPGRPTRLPLHRSRLSDVWRLVDTVRLDEGWRVRS